MQSPPPRRRALDLLLPFALIVGLLVAALWLALKTSGGSVPLWQNPADKIHPGADADFKQALADRTLAPLGPVTPGTTTITLTPAKLTVNMNNPNTGNAAWQLPGTAAPHLTPYKVQLGTATLELYALGMQGPESLRHVGENYPIHFYNLAGQSVSSQSLGQRYLQTRESINTYQLKPQLFMYWRSTDPSLKLLDFKLFDAQTHMPLSGGGGWSSESKEWMASMYISAFSSRPATLVMRIAHSGPVLDLPLTTGTVTRTPQYAFSLLAAENTWEPGGWSMGERLEMNFTPAHRPAWFGLLQVWPPWAAGAVQVDVLGSNGQPLEGGSGGSGGNIKILSALEHAGKHRNNYGTLPATRLRVRLPHDFYTARFDLPAIPELPPLPSQNLFDQKIPYIKFSEPWQMNQFLQDVAQINIENPYIPMTSSHIPTPPTGEFYATTVGGLLTEYTKLLKANNPQLGAITLNPATLTLQPTQSWWEKTRIWFNSLL